MQFEAQIGLKGRVAWLQVVNADESIDQELDGFENLITDAGFSNIAATDEYTQRQGYEDLKYLAIGVGDTTPATTDTSLDNEKFRFSNRVNDYKEYSGSGLSWTQTGVQVFETSVGDLDSSVDGTYKELALCFSEDHNVGDPIFTRTLIKDSSGNPTFISVASDQKLRIRYDMDMQVGHSDPKSQSFEITNIGTLNYESQFYEVPEQNDDLGIFTTQIYRLRWGSQDRSDSNWSTETGANDSYFSPLSGGAYGDGVTSTKVADGVFEVSITGGTEEGNGVINFFRLRINGLSFNWGAFLDSASEFTKEDTHELTISARISFVRG